MKHANQLFSFMRSFNTNISLQGTISEVGKLKRISERKWIMRILMLSGRFMQRNLINLKVTNFSSLNYLYNFSYVNAYVLDIQIWKETQESEDYDWEYIKHITEILQESRANDEYLRVIHIIRSHSLRNIGNILDMRLFTKSYVGTKHLIEEFQQEVLHKLLV